MGLELVRDGTVLGDRYEIRRLVRSAPGIKVWEAFDPVLDREVLVDTLDPRSTGAIRDAFLASALRSARCVNHGVVSVYDTGNDRGTAYVVSELVRGTPLSEIIASTGAFDLALAAALTCEAADALAAAHGVGLFHGALQSSGILVITGRRVKLGGFGSPPTGDRYCAPEIAAGGSPSEAGDVYALAVCATEMLLGGPFDPRVTRMSDALSRADVPAGVRATLERALDPDPRTRAAHVRALQRAFATSRSHQPDTPASTATEAVPVIIPDPTVAQPAITSPPGGQPAPLVPTATPRRETITTDARPRGRRSLLVASVIVALLLIALVVTGVVSLPKRFGDFRAGRERTAAPITVTEIRDFDPFGDNGQENRRFVELAHDGDLASAWPTETYTTATFGNAKPGLGLRMTFDRSSAVRTVTVRTNEPGWSASLFLGDGSGETIDDWGTPVATVEDASTDTTLSVRKPTASTSVLIWFTRLPDTGRLDVREVDVRG